MGVNAPWIGGRPDKIGIMGVLPCFAIFEGDPILRKTMSIMLAGLLFRACVPIQPEPKDGLTDLASALA